MEKIITLILVSMALLSVQAQAYGPYSAQLISTVDGDTFKADVELWPGLTQRVYIRLLGVDTPELKGSTECERVLAVKAKDYLDSLLRSGPIVIRDISLDKFAGRVDATTEVAGINVATALIAAGHGRIYSGGRRLPWCL